MCRTAVDLYDTPPFAKVVMHGDMVVVVGARRLLVEDALGEQGEIRRIKYLMW